MIAPRRVFLGKSRRGGFWQVKEEENKSAPLRTQLLEKDLVNTGGKEERGGITGSHVVRHRPRAPYVGMFPARSMAEPATVGDQDCN